MFKKILAFMALLYTALAMAAVDVNKATEAELDSVKGIGPGTSKLIVEERKKGRFKNWDDFILRVKGVGDRRAEHLSEAGLTVNGAAYKQATAAAKKDDKADTKAKDAKADAKDAKADAKAEKKEAKAEAKAEKKEAKADAKAEKKEAKADAKDAKADAKPAATPASAAKK
jgi:competence protein ComEA